MKLYGLLIAVLAYLALPIVCLAALLVYSCVSKGASL